MGNNNEMIPGGLMEILDEVNPEKRPLGKIDDDKKAAIDDNMRPLGEAHGTHEQGSNKVLPEAEEKKSKLRVINGGKKTLKTLE